MATLNGPRAAQYAPSSPEGTMRPDESTYVGGAAIADKIRLITLPAGTRVDDFQLSLDAANASLTLSAGWEYVDGSASAPAEFIAAGTAAATAGLTRANTTGPRTRLAKDAYLIVTVAGAAISAGTNVLARTFLTNGGVH